MTARVVVATTALVLGAVGCKGANAGNAGAAAGELAAAAAVDVAAYAIQRAAAPLDDPPPSRPHVIDLEHARAVRRDQSDRDRFQSVRAGRRARKEEDSR